MLLIPGLNPRETALLVWAAILLAFVLTKPDVRRSFASTVKVIAGSVFLSVVIVTAVGYSFGTVILLERVGYWENDFIRITVYWFVGVALVTAFSTRRADAHYFRRLLLSNIALAAIVEFIVNLHTFPLPIELVLVPLAFLFVGMQVVAENEPQYTAVKKVVGVCLGLLGLASLSVSLSYVASHLGKVVTSAYAKQLLLPLMLTVFFLPYVYVVRMFTAWQTLLHMTRAGIRGNERLYRFSRSAIIRACGVSLVRVQVFEEEFRGRLWGATEEADVSRVVADFEAVLHARGQVGAPRV